MGETFRVIYGEHDQGAHAGAMERKGRERAEWSASLLRQCGYQAVRVEPVAPPAGPIVVLRRFSAYGPCLRIGAVVRETEASYFVATKDGEKRFARPKLGHRGRNVGFGTHVAPCVSCSDHPETHYPDGLQD